MDENARKHGVVDSDFQVSRHEKACLELFVVINIKTHIIQTIKLVLRSIYYRLLYKLIGFYMLEASI